MKTVEEVKILSDDEVIPFDSSMLKIGEMMKVTGLGGDKVEHVILKTFDRLVSLNNPNCTWAKTLPLEGIKLEPGTRVLLIA